MKILGISVLQALALVVLGGAVGVAANGLREERNRLDLSRDYFPARSSARPLTREVKPDPAATAPQHPKHDLQTVSLAEVLEAFKSPNYQQGSSDSRIFFIDARDDANFKDGHIPGALQLDHYRKDQYLPDVLSMIEQAEKLIVYCNGGNCEDSILVCHDLMDAEVPYEKLYLFEGGMKAWTDAGHPVE